MTPPCISGLHPRIWDTERSSSSVNARTIGGAIWPHVQSQPPCGDAGPDGRGAHNPKAAPGGLQLGEGPVELDSAVPAEGNAMPAGEEASDPGRVPGRTGVDCAVYVDRQRSVCCHRARGLPKSHGVSLRAVPWIHGGWTRKLGRTCGSRLRPSWRHPHRLVVTIRGQPMALAGWLDHL